RGHRGSESLHRLRFPHKNRRTAVDDACFVDATGRVVSQNDPRFRFLVRRSTSPPLDQPRVSRPKCYGAHGSYEGLFNPPGKLAFRILRGRSVERVLLFATNSVDTSERLSRTDICHSHPSKPAGFWTRTTPRFPQGRPCSSMRLPSHGGYFKFQ